MLHPDSPLVDSNAIADAARQVMKLTPQLADTADHALLLDETKLIISSSTDDWDLVSFSFYVRRF